jgi:iron(III) transport system permease protein
VELGRWRWVAVGACAVVVALALAVPVGVLVHWSARGQEGGGTLSAIGAPATRSILVSAATAVVATAAALPVAALATRWRARWSRLLERVSYSANALPGVVIALALVFFASRFAGPLYQTLALLVFAYVVRFLPQALSGAHGALLAVDPRLEEAARGLGRGPRRAFLEVTAPLAAPGVLAGATLVFLSTMKELPATLLLRPIGFDTLATEVWSATAVSSYSEAAPAALALIVLAAPIVLRLVVRPDTREARAEAFSAG